MRQYANLYNPNRSPDWNYGGKKWRLSRSKIDLFTECPRCFYLDNKLGTKRPNMPAFTLNIAVDALFKKEFDAHRKAKTRHPIMEEYGVDAIPFAHKNLDVWRDNFKGIAYTDPQSGIVISGAVDDIWEKADGSLIVVDYKATSKEGTITDLSHTSWAEQYARQIGVYQWLLEQNGFTVDDTGYFVYTNASQSEDAFNDTLLFETTLVPTVADRSWVPGIIKEIHACLESDIIPPSGKACEYCPYREASGKKLLALHRKVQKK